MRNNGVTLISLTITVIVLAIIAMVTVLAMQNEDFFGSANDAAIYSSIREIETAIEVKKMAMEKELYANKDFSKEITIDDFIAEGIVYEETVDYYIYYFIDISMLNAKGNYGNSMSSGTINDKFGINSDFTVYYHSEKGQLYGEIKD